MKKSRFIVWIISLIITCFAITISICYPEYYLSCSIIIFSLILINFSLKRKEINQINSIIMQFMNSCNAKEYHENLNAFMKTCIFTKNQKRYFNLYIARSYIESGDFEKAQEILLDIDKIVGSLNKFTQFVYLQTWCKLFFLERLDEKMKYTLTKIDDVIRQVKNKRMQFQLIQLFYILNIEYSILTNQNIHEVLSFVNNLNKTSQNNYQKSFNNYLLSLTYLRLKDYNNAKESLSEITKLNNDLYINKDSKRLLEEVNSYLLKTSS